MSMFRLAALAALGWPLMCSGCAGTAPAASSANDPSRKALISQACAGVPGAQPKPGEVYERALIELAHVAVAVPRPVGSWLRNRPVSVDRVAQVLVRSGIPVIIPWNTCVDDACRVEKHGQMTITAQLPSRSEDAAHFTLQLDRDQAASGVPESMNLQVSNQDASVLDFSEVPSANSPSIVMTPYLIGGDEDLQRLLQCKTERARLESAH